MGGWHDASAVRPGRILGPIVRPYATAADQFGLVLWRAGTLRTLADVVASAWSEWADGSESALRTVDDELGDRPLRRLGAYLWADLMRRTFGLDVLACPGCGGRPRLLALIEHADTVARILRHLRLPTDRPEPRRARSPPHGTSDSEVFMTDDRASYSDAAF